MAGSLRIETFEGVAAAVGALAQIALDCVRLRNREQRHLKVGIADSGGPGGLAPVDCSP